MDSKLNNLHLTQRQILKQTAKGVKKYENLNFFEQFAMFMGTSQLLEIGLKNLLVKKYSYQLSDIEKWTLGRSTNELKRNHLRPDLIILLESVVKYRNYIAHEMLVNELLTQTLIKNLKPKKYYSKELRQLHKGIFELEQLMFLFTWTEENKAWN